MNGCVEENSLHVIKDELRFRVSVMSDYASASHQMMTDGMWVYRWNGSSYGNLKPIDDSSLAGIIEQLWAKMQEYEKGHFPERVVRGIVDTLGHSATVGGVEAQIEDLLTELSGKYIILPIPDDLMPDGVDQVYINSVGGVAWRDHVDNFHIVRSCPL